MSTTQRYPAEVRKRAVRLVLEHEERYASQWAAIASIAEKFGCASATLRRWVRQAERDEGRRDDGLTTKERGERRRLRRENKIPREEKGILKEAAAWFAKETDSVPNERSSS